VSYYAINSYGAGVTLGYPINETSRLTFGLTAQHDSIKPGTYSADEIYDFIEREGKPSPTSRPTGLVGIDPEQRRAGHPWSLAKPQPDVTVPGSDLSSTSSTTWANLPADHNSHGPALAHQAGLRQRLWLHRRLAVL
jgi:outer membrane protein insertion porin family